VLIVSTELDEVLALGDRIAVMYQGRIVAILGPDEATPERLGLYMGGATEAALEVGSPVAAGPTPPKPGVPSTTIQSGPPA